jgi:CheY-like chemotaxis protein
VVEAADGSDALATLESGGFDVAVLDWRMPLLDGYEVAEAIRRREASAGERRLPIVALSARSHADWRQESSPGLIDAYLIKPVHPDVVLETLERVVFLPESGDGANANAPPIPLAAVSEGPDPDAVNLNMVKEMNPCDEPLSLIEEYLRETPRLLDRIQAAVRRGDGHAASFGAHKLATHLGRVAALRARDAALELEKTCEGKDLEAALRDLDGLAPRVERIGRDLNRILEGVS